MVTMIGSDTLSRFLKAAEGRPFQWAPPHHDCLSWLADWVAVRRGVDPARSWRGSYRTERGAIRILKREGGAIALLDKALLPLGITRTDVPGRGDIGVIKTPEGAVGVIVLDGSTAALGRGGLMIRRIDLLRPVAAWAM